MPRLSYACRKRISRDAARRIGDFAIRSVSATRPGAERGTVNRMLPDFRFVLGAILAITLLAVAGLGLVASVRLVQEARINPIEDARSLAFAGHAQWNQFYDPEGARRFEDLAGKAPATEARLETPAETAQMAPPVAAPPAAVPHEAPQEETASLPAHQPDPVIGAVDAPSIADDKPPASDPPPADPAQLPETATDRERRGPARASGSPSQHPRYRRRPGLAPHPTSASPARPPRCPNWTFAKNRRLRHRLNRKSSRGRRRRRRRRRKPPSIRCRPRPPRAPVQNPRSAEGSCAPISTGPLRSASRPRRIRVSRRAPPGRATTINSPARPRRKRTPASSPERSPTARNDGACAHRAPTSAAISWRCR